MKIKTLLNLAIAILMIVFVACDDDINEVGNSIQPGGDDIAVSTDTVLITAKTISLKDSVYARTDYGLLGSYTDPVFGKVSSDYLTELYCPENTTFPDKTFSIDSAFIEVISEQFLGDSIAPFGISAYRVTQPLKANFFTNIDPKKYSDMTQPLGRGVFTIKDTPKSGGLRSFLLRADQSLGQEFYDEWKRSSATFKNSESLKKFFKGIYVTNSFGAANLLSINTTVLRIYVKYTGRNVANTADSTRVGLFRLAATPEVIQMNRVQNTIPDDLFTNSDTRTYLKSPAGVCTELTIPLAEIMKASANTGKNNNKLNAANFKLKGYTEEEAKSNLGKSPTLLFINKDSLNNFFLEKKMTDAKTSFIMELSSATNSYNFTYGNTRGATSNNIANMINYYMDYYKGKDNVPDLTYVVIPISTRYQPTSTSSGSTVNTYTNVYHQMSPTSSILRTDKDNMKMSLIFSSYNSQY